LETNYQKEKRHKLLEKLKNQKVENPEQVLKSIETYCEIILRLLFKENG
jgi:hypothetical protein